MKILRFIFSLRFLVILIIFLSGLLLGSKALDLTIDADEISEAFETTPYHPKHHFLKLETGKLHYVTVGDTSLTPVLLIHGSPGTWDNFVPLVSKTAFLDNYFAIIPDRPGYGKTSTAPDQKLETQAQQARYLMDLHFYGKKGIVLGHSFGAAVALAAAGKYDDQVSGVLSVAGTIAHPHQPRRWYNYVVKYSPVKYLIKDELLTSNREMWALTEELKTLEEDVPDFHGRAAFISAGRDFLVHEKSAPYILSLMDSAHTRLFFDDKLDHFTIWTDKEYVLEALHWTASGS